MVRNNKGQSTLEYIILVTAVLVVIIGIVVGKDSLFSNQYNKTLTTAIDGMENMGSRLNRSHTTPVGP
jgi:uncharacterized protein (UPF0333 family)